MGHYHAGYYLVFVRYRAPSRLQTQRIACYTLVLQPPVSGKPLLQRARRRLLADYKPENTHTQRNRKPNHDLVLTGSDDVMDTAPNILLTGGTGFIGSRLTRALLDDGYRVTILTRKKRKKHKSVETGQSKCCSNCSSRRKVRKGRKERCTDISTSISFDLGLGGNNS